MTWPDLVLAVLWFATVVWLLYRFPLQSIGMATALYLWTVDPVWCWVTISLVAVPSLMWAAAGRPQPTAKPVVRAAVRYPLLAVIVVSAPVSGLAESPVAPVSFAVLVVSLAVFCWSHRKTTPETTVETTPEPLALPRPIAGALGTGTAVPCPHCENPLAVFYGDHPTASCFACGAQFIRVSEQLSPTGSPLWLPAPT